MDYQVKHNCKNCSFIGFEANTCNLKEIEEKETITICVAECINTPKKCPLHNKLAVQILDRRNDE